jgi:hypothetical protein
MPTDTAQLDHTDLVFRRLKSMGRKIRLLFFGDNRPHYDGEGKDILCDYVVVTEPRRTRGVGNLEWMYPGSGGRPPCNDVPWTLLPRPLGDQDRHPGQCSRRSRTTAGPYPT